MEQNIKQKIFLTGANGFIGKEVATYLADNGYEITAVVRQRKWNHEHIRFIEGDLINLDEMNINKSDFSAVVHMAAYIGMYEKGGKLFRDNYELTRKILEFFKGSKAYFIYFSSIEAFGTTTEKEVNEHDAPVPITDYGKIKLKCEKLVKKSGQKYVILRMGNAEGNNNGLMRQVKTICSEKGIYNKLQQFIFKQIINDYELSIVYVADICQIVDKIIKIQPENQTYFVIGSRIQVGQICHSNKSRFKFLLPFLITLCKMASIVKLSHIIVYITEGGLRRKCRNYSNKKISTDLTIHIRHVP